MSSFSSNLLEYESESFAWFPSESPFLLKISRIFKHYDLDSSFHIDLLEKQFNKDSNKINEEDLLLLDRFTQTKDEKNGYYLFYYDFANNVQSFYQKRKPLEADLLLSLIIELFNLFNFEETEENLNNFIYPYQMNSLMSSNISSISYNENDEENYYKNKEYIEDHINDQYDITKPRGLIKSLIRLLPYFKVSNLFITKFYDLLRLSMYKNYNKLITKNEKDMNNDNEINSKDKREKDKFNNENLLNLDLLELSSTNTNIENTSTFYIPLSFHSYFLSIFNTCLQFDYPPHIKFPGEKKSHIRFEINSITSNINPTCLPPPSAASSFCSVSSYILNFWIFIQSNSNREFELFEYTCRDSTSLQCCILQKNFDGSYPLSLMFNKREKDKIVYNVKLIEGTWNFVTLRHLSSLTPLTSSSNSLSASFISAITGNSSLDNKEKIYFYINKELSFESILTNNYFPTPNSSLEFKFGSNFDGLISSVTLFNKNYLRKDKMKESSDEIKEFNHFLKISHSLGPYISDYRSLNFINQSTLETGQNELNTFKYLKLLDNFTVMFSLDSLSLLNNNLYSKFVNGVHSGDTIKMSPIEFEVSNPNSPSPSSSIPSTFATKMFYKHPAINLINRESWILAHLESGGCYLPLYLFNLYLAALNEEVQKNSKNFPSDFCSLFSDSLIPSNTLRSFEEQLDTDNTEDSKLQIQTCSIPLSSLNKMKELRTAALSCLDSLSYLLFKHPENREHFIQNHGCHLLSFYLITSLTCNEAKQFFLDKVLIDKVNRVITNLFDLNSFSEYKSDLIASALQGILFEFKIWKNLPFKLFNYYLTNIINMISKELKTKFYLYIGLENFLNFLRIYVFKNLNFFTSSNPKEEEKDIDSSKEEEIDSDTLEEKDNKFLFNSTKINLSSLSEVNIVKFIIINGYEFDLEEINYKKKLTEEEEKKENSNKKLLNNIVSILNNLTTLINILLIKNTNNEKNYLFYLKNLELLINFIIENNNNFFLHLLFNILYNNLLKNDDNIKNYFFLNNSESNRSNERERDSSGKNLDRYNIIKSTKKNSKNELIPTIFLKLLKINNLALSLRFKNYILYLTYFHLNYNHFLIHLSAFYKKKRIIYNTNEESDDSIVSLDNVFIKIFNFWKNYNDYTEILLSNNLWGPSFTLNSLTKIKNVREKDYENNLHNNLTTFTSSTSSGDIVDTFLVSTHLMDSEMLQLINKLPHTLWIFFSLFSPLLYRCSYDGSTQILKHIHYILSTSSTYSNNPTVKQQQAEFGFFQHQLDALALNKHFNDMILGSSIYYYFFNFYNCHMLNRENFIEYFIITTPVTSSTLPTSRSFNFDSVSTSSSISTIGTHSSINSNLVNFNFNFGLCTDYCFEIFSLYCFHRIKIFFFDNIELNLKFWNLTETNINKFLNSYFDNEKIDIIIGEIIMQDEVKDENLINFSLSDAFEISDGVSSDSPDVSSPKLAEKVKEFKEILINNITKKFFLKIFNNVLKKLIKSFDSNEDIECNIVDIASFIHVIYEKGLSSTYNFPTSSVFSIPELNSLFNLPYSKEESEKINKYPTLKKHFDSLSSVKNEIFNQILDLLLFLKIPTRNSNIQKQWDSYRYIFSVLINFLPYVSIQYLDKTTSIIVLWIKEMSKINLHHNSSGNSNENFLYLITKILYISKKVIFHNPLLCLDFHEDDPEQNKLRSDKFRDLVLDIKETFSRAISISPLNTSSHYNRGRSSSLSSTSPATADLENRNIAKNVQKLSEIFKCIESDEINYIFEYLNFKLLDDFEKKLIINDSETSSDKHYDSPLFPQDSSPLEDTTSQNDNNSFHEISPIENNDMLEITPKEDSLIQNDNYSIKSSDEENDYNILPDPVVEKQQLEEYEKEILDSKPIQQEEVVNEIKEIQEIEENVMENVPTEIVPSEIVPTENVSTENKIPSKTIFNWIQHQNGLLADIIDTERGKLSKFVRYIDLSQDSTKKFWKKLKRKIESEYFFDSHKCQWKLGISHEGPFYGRKRIVLRPRYDFVINKRETKLCEYKNHLDSSYNEDFPEKNGENLNSSISFNEISTEELDRALVNAHIVDITQGEGGTVSGTSSAAGTSTSSTSTPTTPLDINEELTGDGDGWGLIGSEEDVEEEGEIVRVQTQELRTNDGVKEGISQENAQNVDEKTKTKNYTVVDTIKSEMLPSDEYSSYSSHFEEELRGFYHTSQIETAPRTHGVPNPFANPNITEYHVIMITASGNFPGYLSFNGEEIFFRSSLSSVDENGNLILEDSAAINLNKDSNKIRRRKWRIEYASHIFLRRYRLRDSALEVFFNKGKHRSFFVDFGHTKENVKNRNSFINALYAKISPKCFKQYPNTIPYNKILEIQKKWMTSKISNFDYLMALNTLAGRSYNDLCQYPVMPWVIADYTSPSINLKNYKTFRDLSKPMGAINDKRFQEFLNRYNSFEENVSSGIPPFMYGSHYSTMVGVVLHFLVRLEPFASLHKEMQNGHFDVPDRLFSSIPRSFLHNTTQLSEVKEITPEWFTNPDMFRNINHFDFGPTQDGEAVDDVELPPWASCPEEFIRINREALESDYVSEHLNDWIDLIFGYKQRGPESVKAHNVFYYLTYSGSIDHYAIEDEMIRRATELQIAHFGQVPLQLFKTAHPKKKSDKYLLVRPLKKIFIMNNVYNKTMLSNVLAQVNENLLNLEDSFSGNNKTKKFLIEPKNEEEIIIYNAPTVLLVRNLPQSIVNIQVFDNKLLCILDNGTLDLLRFSASEETKQALLVMQNNTKMKSREAKLSSSSTSPIPSPSPSPSEDIINENLEKSYTPKSVNNDDLLTQAPQPSLLKPKEPLLLIEREPISSFPCIFSFKNFFYLSKFQSSYNESLTNNSSNNDFHIKETTMNNNFNYDFNDNFSYPELVSSLIKVNQVQRLIYLYGSSTGIISIREIDQRTGLIKSAGEFLGHKRRVVSLCVETLASNENDVIASLDEGGDLLIWTTKFPSNNPTNIYDSSYEIVRRPQFHFHVHPSQDMHCHITWSSSIVIVSSGGCVYQFSIERNELIRKFYISYSPQSLASINYTSSTSSLTETGSPLIDLSTPNTHDLYHSPDKYIDLYNQGKFCEYSFTGSPSLYIEDQLKRQKWGWSYLSNDILSVNPSSLFYSSSNYDSDCLSSRYFTKKMIYSSHGQIIFAAQVASFEEKIQITNLLLSYNLSGHLTGYLELNTSVTCLLSLDYNSSGGINSDYFAVGCHDGSVRFFNCINLKLIYSFIPSENCTTTTLKRDIIRSKDSETIDNSPIISISLGPSSNFPVVIIISTEKGNLYFKPLPDFLKWERQKNISALTQLASVPLEAVKETFLQASEAAGSIAINTRIIVDEAINEFSKKMKKSSIVQNFSNFFGGGRRNSLTGSGNNE